MRIELVGVSKTFSDGNKALEGITYREDFNALAIIGPSGGGKSTLLRILGGLIAPSTGEVSFNGDEVCFDEKHLIRHRREIGFVFQAKGLFNHLTARQNIILPLVNVHGYTKTSAGHRDNCWTGLTVGEGINFLMSLPADTEMAAQGCRG